MDIISRAAQVHTVLSWQLQGLTDEQAVQVPELYPVWQPDTAYETGKIVYYVDCIYRVEQAHTSQSHQPPGSEGMLAVYRPIRAADGIYTWLYGEAVEIGAKRIDPTDGLLYEVYTPAGANIWEPHTVPAIWRLVKQPESPEETPEEIPDMPEIPAENEEE